MREITARQEGPKVLLIVKGFSVRDVVAELPWNVALDVARAIYEKAKDAEEVANAEGIVFDQALLIRMGARIGFSSHPGIQAEAAKEAVGNRELRRYLPGGVKSQEQFGRPTIIRHPPRRELGNDQEGL